MMNGDVELLGRYAREGAEDAFAEIVRRHLGLVYGSAMRRVNGNAALAEEVVQGVFVEVAREAAQLAEKVEGGVALAGWLYVATRNAAANALRAEARRVRREQEAFVMSEIESGDASGGIAARGMSGGGVGNEEMWAQVRPELEAVMDELSEKDREAVLLRFFEGRAFGEIGAALRVSEDAARVRVNRALEKMRALLGRRGVTSTAAALGGLLAGNAAVAAPAGLAASVTGAAIGAGSVAMVAAGVGAHGAVAGAMSAGGAGVLAAGGGAGVGAGMLSFMCINKLVTGVACVVAAVGVGTAAWLSGELEAARAGMAARANEKERAVELEKRLAEAERRFAETNQASEEARKALAELTAKSNGAATVKSVAAQGVEVANTLYADAGFQEATLRMFRTAMPFKYAAFYRKRGLSTAQVAELEKALVSREQAQIDRNAAARSQKMSIADPALSKVRIDGFDEAYGQLRRVLGEEGLRQFMDYEKRLGTQKDAGEALAASLYSDAPLTLAQSEQLAEVLAANRISEKTGSIRTFTGYRWDDVAGKVAEIMPEAQAGIVRQYIERVKAEQVWRDYWRAAQAGKPLSGVAAGKE